MFVELFQLVLSGFSFAAPIAAITAGHPDPQIAAIHDLIQHENRDFYTLGGSLDHLALIMDPVKGVTPFILSGSGPLPMNQRNASTFCKRKGGSLPSREQLEALERSLRVDGDYRPDLIVGLEENSYLWSLVEESIGSDLSFSFNAKVGSFSFLNSGFKVAVRCVLKLQPVDIVHLYIKEGDTHRLYGRLLAAAQSYSWAAEAVPGTLLAAQSHRKVAQIHTQLTNYKAAVTSDESAILSYKAFIQSFASGAEEGALHELVSLFETLERNEAEVCAELDADAIERDAELANAENGGASNEVVGICRNRLVRVHAAQEEIRADALASRDALAARAEITYDSHMK